MIRCVDFIIPSHHMFMLCSVLFRATPRLSLHRIKVSNYFTKKKKKKIMADYSPGRSYSNSQNISSHIEFSSFVLMRRCSALLFSKENTS